MSILKENIRVLNYNGEVVVFPSNDDIEQITVQINMPLSEKLAVNNFIETVVSRAKNYDIETLKDTIEDSQGNTIAEIDKYTTPKYELIMTTSENNREIIFIIDIINNFTRK